MYKMIEQFVKYRKFLLYLALSLIIIILASFLFYHANNIYNNVFDANQVNGGLKTGFYNLFVYMVILLVLPFSVFFVHAIVELSTLMGELKYKKIDQKETTLTTSEKDEAVSEEEEKQKEKERIAQLEKHYRDKEKEIIGCLDKVNANEQDDKGKLAEKILSCIGDFYEIVQGELYIKQQESNKLVLSAAYAYYMPEEKIFEFDVGEGLIGQVAKQGEALNLDSIPEGYITVSSGLGSATPTNLIIFPLFDENNNVNGVIELASFKAFSEFDLGLFKNISVKVGKLLDNSKFNKDQQGQ